MKTNLRHSTWLLAILILLTASVAAADRINLIEGRPFNGTIVGVTRERVSIDLDNKKEEVAANMIESTVYEGEPSGINAARIAIRNSRMDEALDALSKVDAAKLPDNAYIKQDYAFLLAYVKGQLALTESGDLKEAENAVASFIKDHSRSYHYYEACQLYGDILVTAGKFEQAKKAYDALSKAPWPEYSLKAKVALGNAEISENKIAEARKLFDEVIKAQDDSSQVETQKHLAQVGLSKCLVAENKIDQAVKELEAFIAKTNPENTVLQATIYNALGFAYEKADNAAFAINAYLSVDVLYSGARNEHIAALRSLSLLWRKTGRNDRAEEVEKRLKEMYNLAVK